MLVEHYEPDKLFEEVVGYMPEMAAELVKIDAYLEDEKLFRLIKKDLTQRHPKTCQTGRNFTPVEVLLRILVVKRLYGYSYEETEQRVSDRLRLRQFCRVYLQEVPDDTTVIRWANQIQLQTLEQFNQRILQLAVERKVTKGRTPPKERQCARMGRWWRATSAPPATVVCWRIVCACQHGRCNGDESC